MQFLIVLHTQEGRTDYGVTVPCLPGCVSAGDTLEEAFANVHEAILGHLDVMVEDGQPIPEPNDMVPQLAPGQMIGAVKINLADLDALRETVRLNISMARRALERIDEAAKLAGTTRSGFLTMAALTHIERRQQPVESGQTRGGAAG